MDQIGDLDDQAFFIEGVWDFGDNDLVAAFIILDYLRYAAGDDTAAAGRVSRPYRFLAIDNPASREIRPLDMF